MRSTRTLHNSIASQRRALKLPMFQDAWLHAMWHDSWDNGTVVRQAHVSKPTLPNGSWWRNDEARNAQGRRSRVLPMLPLLPLLRYPSPKRSWRMLARAMGMPDFGLSWIGFNLDA